MPTLLEVSVTKKGQATIPKRLRDKVVVIETKDGILLKPPPRPEDDFGSLKDMFKDKTSRRILNEARAEDAERERKLLELIGK